MYHIFLVQGLMIKLLYETLLIKLKTGRTSMTADITLARLIRLQSACCDVPRKFFATFDIAKLLLVKIVHVCSIASFCCAFKFFTQSYWVA